MTTLTTPITIEGTYTLDAGTNLSFSNTDAFLLPLDENVPVNVDILGGVVVQGNGAAAVRGFDLLEGLYYTGTVALEATSTILVQNSGSGDAIGYDALSFGPTFTNSAFFTVSNSGTGAAIGLWNSDDKNPMTNYGHLVVSSAASSATGVLAINRASVVNTGVISATSPLSAIGLQFNGVAGVNNSGTITATATAPGGYSAAVVFDATAANCVLTNYGTVTAQKALDTPGSGHANVVVYNFGTMTGDINAGQSFFSIQNTGTLTGNLYLGSNASSADFSKGTFNGRIYIDTSGSNSTFNDVVTLGKGGSVTLSAGDHNFHLALTGSGLAGVSTVLNLAGSYRDAVFTANADGSSDVTSSISGSAHLINVTTVNFADGSIDVAGAPVIEPYKLYMGRAPTAAEITYWDGRLAAGGHVQDIVAAIIADPYGQAYTASQISAQYQTWFGRAPNASEIGVWEGLIVGGATYDTLRAALVSAPEGQAHQAVEIKGFYETYLGRDPGPAEVSYWENQISGGDSIADVRTGIVEDNDAKFHTATTVSSLYETFMGREVRADEASVWQALVLAGADFGDVRTAILGSTEGHAHTDAVVTSLYDTYFGRDPFASELSVWEGLIAGGADFGVTRAALLADGAGVAHTQATTVSLYETYFGRDPSAAEIGVWEGLISGGDDFYQLRDTLERQSTASSVEHVTVPGGVQVVSMGSAANLTVVGFDPVGDTVLLSAAQFGGINPLNSTHAHSITALDGTNDVLITLDATHSILFEHMLLSSLHASDFVFT